MTRINLSLPLHTGLEREPQFAALANIYDITPGRKVLQNKEDLLIPSKWSLPIDLNPGRYLIEARLPSGRVLKEEVEVGLNEIPVELKLPSPHEWLAMQVLMGNVKQSPEVYHREEYRPHSQSVRTWIVSSKSPCARIQENADREHFESRGYLESNESKIERGYFFLLPELVEIPSFIGNQPQPVRSDSITDFFELNLERILISGSSPGYVFDIERKEFERLYLWTQTAEGSTQYSVLPIPWGLHDGGEADIQVYVNKEFVRPEYSKSYDALHRVSIIAEDDAFASMIGYLGGGNLSAASVILKRAEDMLFGKRTNPFKAAAGAYVMLGQMDPTQKEKWHAWIHNLMNFFDWLPDGAIQWAWLKLAQPDSDLGEIRECLLEAYWRGLPYYSAGVKMLLDGLSIFSDIKLTQGERDLKIEEARKNVRRLALRIDPTRPFTSVIVK